MKDDHLFFDKRRLSAQIRGFLAGNLNAPKGLDSEKVLNAIEVQQGILVERMEDQYSFSHLTLQEYLAAQYLIDNNEWKGLVQQHITDNRWREIFLLLPGLMSGRLGADSLLLAMKERADSYLDAPRLKALVRWAEKAIDQSEEKLKPAAKRSVAIFLARALDRDRALALALALDRARARVKIFHTVDFRGLVRSLEKLQNNKPNEKASYEEKKKFIESIYDLWFSALGIEPETASLSPEEAQSLADYLYICELMIRCKEGATRVSPDVWQSIESSILTVPSSDMTAD